MTYKHLMGVLADLFATTRSLGVKSATLKKDIESLEKLYQDVQESLERTESEFLELKSKTIISMDYYTKYQNCIDREKSLLHSTRENLALSRQLMVGVLRDIDINKEKLESVSKELSQAENNVVLIGTKK